MPTITLLVIPRNRWSIRRLLRQGRSIPAPCTRRFARKGRACPKCDMALEPESIPAPEIKIEYTCPLHPEIVRDEPGNFPICGMALEPRTVTLEDEENPELRDMTRRFWIGILLTVPLAVVAMGRHVPGTPFDELASSRELNWLELLLATPVVLWGGWPFFERGWQSLVNRSLRTCTKTPLSLRERGWG